MLEIEHRVIMDKLNEIENLFINEWDNLPSIYMVDDPMVIRKYENIAGAINHIEKCKKLLNRS